MTGGIVCQNAAPAPKLEFTSGNTIGSHEGYNKIRTLGRGSYGKTMLCVRSSDQMNVVVKRIHVEGRRARMKHILREVEVMKKTHHPNVISFLDAWQSSKAVYIVMDHAERGDLEQLVIHCRKNLLLLGETRVKCICHQVASALDYLHGNCIIHRDIKAANVFLDANGNVKLGDFGMSTILETSDSFASSHVGTPFYMSPELMEKKKYTSKTDIWAFGVLVYLLMYFSYPFVGETIGDLRAQILEGRVRHPARIRYSRMLVDIVEESLEIEPEMRPSSKSLSLLLAAHPSLPVAKKRPLGVANFTTAKRRPRTDHVQQAVDLMLFLFEEACERQLIECSSTLSLFLML